MFTSLVRTRNVTELNAQEICRYNVGRRMGDFRAVRKRLETTLSPFARFNRIRPLLRRRLTSVFGHIVTDTPNRFTAEIYRAATVTEFQQSLDFLQENFEFVSLPEVVGAFSRRNTVARLSGFPEFRRRAPGNRGRDRADPESARHPRDLLSHVAGVEQSISVLWPPALLPAGIGSNGRDFARQPRTHRRLARPVRAGAVG